MSERTCRNCRYSVSWKQSRLCGGVVGEIVECHRHAPRAGSATRDGVGCVVFPRLPSPSTWCGEWEAREGNTTAEGKRRRRPLMGEGVTR